MNPLARLKLVRELNALRIEAKAASGIAKLKAIKRANEILAELGYGKAEAGNEGFVHAPDGGIDFGNIPGLASVMEEGKQYPAAPIRMEEGGNYGEAHIQPERLKEFQEHGYPSAADFLSDVAQHYSHIYEQPNGRLLLVKRNGRARFASVELQKEANGYYGVTTLFLESSKSKNNKPYEERGGRKLLWPVSPTMHSGNDTLFPDGPNKAGEPSADDKAGNFHKDSIAKNRQPPSQTPQRYATLAGLLNATERLLASGAGRAAGQSRGMWLKNAEFHARETFKDESGIIALRMKYSISRPQDLQGGHAVFGIPLPKRRYQLGDDVPGVGKIVDLVGDTPHGRQFLIGGQWYAEKSIDPGFDPTLDSASDPPRPAGPPEARPRTQRPQNRGEVCKRDRQIEGNQAGE